MKLITILALVSIVIIFAFPMIIHAGLTTENCDSTSDTCIPNPLNAGSFTELANEIAGFLILVLSPIAVIMTLYAGFLYMTSGGSQDKVEKAHKTLTYVLIGIAILIISYSVTSIIDSFFL